MSTGWARLPIYSDSQACGATNTRQLLDRLPAARYLDKKATACSACRLLEGNAAQVATAQPVGCPCFSHSPSSVGKPTFVSHVKRCHPRTQSKRMSQCQPPLVCSFVRAPDATCSHHQGPLFSTEYKRTNRTRATKVVRCFPHCCPEHRPRSYCGAPVYVQLDATTDRLHVFGRFEEHKLSDEREDTPQHLELGQRVLLSEILEPSQSDSVWVKGTLVTEESGDQGDEQHGESRIYALRGSDDGFGHWEYDWKSGTSQRHRMTPHHFRVYVFEASSDDASELRVVGIATSPPFTFVVYRKHQHSVEALRDPLNEVDVSQDRDGDDTIQAVDQPAAAMEDALWHNQHRALAKASTNLSILVAIVNEADPHCLLQYSSSVFATLQATLATKNDSGAPEHMLLHYVNHCVPQLISILPTQHTASLRDAGVDEYTSLWAELVCFLLDPHELMQSLAYVGSHASLPTFASDTGRGVFVQWLEMVASQVEGYLQRHDQSTDHVVDDAVTIGLRTFSAACQVRIRTLLRNTRVVGDSLFDYLVAKLQVDGHHESLDLNEQSSLLRGRWICRGFEIDDAPSISLSDRRRSWPQVQLRSSRKPSESSKTIHCGLLATVASIYVALGFDISVSHDESAAVSLLHLRPLASLVAETSSMYRLDGDFHDATTVLPLQLGSLLALYPFWNRVFYRGKLSKTTDASSDLQLEVVAVGGGGLLRRFLVRFEKPVTDRRGFRLQVHVGIEDNRETLLRPRQQQVESGDSSESSEERDSDAATDQQVPDPEQQAAHDIQRQYDSVHKWHQHLSFRATYLALA